MKSAIAALTMACLILGILDPAVRASARAADRFSEVPLESPPHASHRFAYLSLVTGAALVAGSFALSRHADRVYSDYLESTDPDEITRLFDETTRYDRYSSTALISGEILIATGLYFRFLRRPGVSRVRVSMGPAGCAVALRF
jgi:hypothetical protein